VVVLARGEVAQRSLVRLPAVERLEVREQEPFCLGAVSNVWGSKTRCGGSWGLGRAVVLVDEAAKDRMADDLG
jgi:hypothetical protein